MATEKNTEQTMPPREPRQSGEAEREHRREEGLGRERSDERKAGRETTESARER